MRKFVALLVALAASAASADVTLKVGTLAPQGSPWDEALRDLGQRWAEASGGQVKLRVYAGGTQGDEGEMLRKVGVGQLQGAAISNVGLHDVVPEAQAFSAPLLFRDEDEVRCAFAAVRARLEAALRERGLVALQWGVVGTAHLFCRSPHRTPSELARAKVFAWEGDPAMVKAWREAGLHPVVLSSTDLVPAFTTGMIDCASNVPVYMLTTRLFERARYLLDLPLGFVLGATVIRQDAWERVPPELRDRLLGIAGEVGARLESESRRLEADAIGAMKQQGLEVLSADPADWQPTLEKTWTVIRGEVVPAPFFDAVKGARDTCRADASPAQSGGR